MKMCEATINYVTMWFLYFILEKLSCYYYL